MKPANALAMIGDIAGGVICSLEGTKVCPSGLN